MKRWMLVALFGLYLAVVLASSQDRFQEDEGTYVGYATNLTHGFYSHRDPSKVDLRAGPGYPLLLAPFVALGAPWSAAKMLNIVLMLGGVLLVYKTLRIYVPERTAAWSALLMGLYPPFLRHIHQLMTETFAVFLVCAFGYFFCRACRDDQPRRGLVLGAAAALAWLALTRTIFGYVILVTLVMCLLAVVLRQPLFKRPALIFALALVLCTPYLLYTWSLTGRVFYWSDGGGSALYWMSTPYEGELGDWQNWITLPATSRFRQNHSEFFDRLGEMSHTELHESMRRQALGNIAAHPGKYLRNWTANVGRLLFSFPYTDTPQKLSTLFYAVPNTILLALLSLSLLVVIVRQRMVSTELYVLLLTGLVGLAGSTLLSAVPRYFTPLVPVFTIWIVTVLSSVVEVRIRPRGENAARVGV